MSCPKSVDMTGKAGSYSPIDRAGDDRVYCIHLKKNKITGGKNMNEVYEFLKACGTYFLATDENGQPRVRPFGTVDLYKDRLYFQTGKKKAVAKQLKANPKLEISAMSADGRWLRLEAEAELDEDIAAQEHMLTAYPDLRAMYTPGDGNTEVYFLKNVKAGIFSFTAAPETFEF